MSINTGSMGRIILPTNSFFDDDNIQSVPDIQITSDVNEPSSFKMESDNNVISGIEVVNSNEPTFDKNYSNNNRSTSMKSDATIEINFDDNDFSRESDRNRSQNRNRDSRREDSRRDSRRDDSRRDDSRRDDSRRDDSRNKYDRADSIVSDNSLDSRKTEEKNDDSKKSSAGDLDWDFLLNKEKKKKEIVIESFEDDADEKHMTRSVSSDESEIRPSYKDNRSDNRKDSRSDNYRSESRPESRSVEESYPEPDESIPVFKSEDEEKMYYLIQLKGLEKRGAELSKPYNLKSPLSEIRMEYKAQYDLLEQESSVKFWRKMLVFGATGVEFLNKRYDPVGAKLDGWSESILENSGDYDGIFERLHKKYKGSSEMAPEVELLMALAGSAFTFHLTNSLFKTAMPNLASTISQNPGLMSGLFGATMDAANKTKMQQAQTPIFNGSNMTGPSMDLSQLFASMGLGQVPPNQMNTAKASNFSDSNFVGAMNNPVPMPVGSREMNDPPLGKVFRQQTENSLRNNISQAINMDDDNMSVRSDSSEIKTVSIGRAKGLKNSKGVNGQKKSSFVINL